MSEEEKQAVEIFTDLINYLEKWNDNLTVIPEDKKYYKTFLNFITKLQKENEEKDKIIYQIARSNVKLKGYEIEERYIDTTISFFTKYVKNLERNQQWRNDKNE